MAKKRSKKSGKNSKPVPLTVYRKRDRIIDLREAITKRLDRIGKSRLWLAQETKMRTATVYDYLANKTDVMGEKVERMLSAVGLEIRERQ